MLEEGFFCSGPRNAAAASNAPASVEHAKTAAARKRASHPLPLEVMLLTTAQVARALGVSAITVFRYSKAGHLIPIKLGDGSARSPRRYRAIDVARFIESRLSTGATG